MRASDCLLDLVLMTRLSAMAARIGAVEAARLRSVANAFSRPIPGCVGRPIATQNTWTDIFTITASIR